MEKFNLDEEIKCNFKITKERKKLWDKELEIVKIIDNICRNNNIKYSIAGGTLLGAIRHEGFIPWDDDIDIVMLRSDYDNFINIAMKEIKKPYFVQCYKTEEGYYYGHAQIRNSNTTAIINGDQFNNFNHGIFVDIFPLDNVPDNFKERKRFITKIKKIKKEISWLVYPNDGKWYKKIIKSILIKIFLKNKKEELITNLNELVLKYNNDNTKELGAIAFRPEEFKYKREWFKDIRDFKFENLILQGSNMFDEWLSTQYGNYMEIPESKSGSLHGSMFYDTEKSYKEYNAKEVIEKLK